jgi:hypothetical protein
MKAPSCLKRSAVCCGPCAKGCNGNREFYNVTVFKHQSIFQMSWRAELEALKRRALAQT